MSGTPAPLSLEGLSDQERFIALKLNEEISRRNRCELVSRTFHRALDEVERFYELSIRALSALIKVGRLDEAFYDADKFCRNVLDIFSDELEFDNCSIMVKTPDGKALRVVAGKGRGDRYAAAGSHWKTGNVIKIGEGVAGAAAKDGTHIFVPDISKDYRFKSLDMHVEVASLLSVPIRTDKEIIGVINFSHPVA